MRKRHRNSSPKSWRQTLSGFTSSIAEMTLLSWKAHPLSFLISLITQAVSGIIPLITAWVFKQIIDTLTQSFNHQIAAETALVIFFVLICIHIGATLVAHIASMIGSVSGNFLILHLKLTTQRLIYDKITRLDSLAYFEDPSFHDLLDLARQGIYSGPARMTNTYLSLIGNLVTVLSFMGALFFISPLLGAMMLLVNVPLLYSNMRITYFNHGVNIELEPKVRREAYYAGVLSNADHAKELRLYGLSDYFTKIFNELTLYILERQHKEHRRIVKWRFWSGLLSLIVASLAFIIIVFAAISRQISIGDIALYVTAIRSVQGSMSGIVASIAQIGENALFFMHYRKLIELPSMLDNKSPIVPVPPLRQGIEFRNVSFRYSEEHPYILHNINMTIPAGKSLALVGLNGAGKTTMVKLLTRLYDPSEGQILWDGIDIRQFEPDDYRQKIATIFQDFVRYQLSAGKNIGLGQVEFIEELQRIESAATIAGAHDLISNLDRGYDTVLSRWLLDHDEEGVDLSGGQWQKVATARLFMRTADLLVLDEPTAALDAQAEFEIYGKFKDLVAGKTSLLISHRFSTVKLADLIAVLEDGVIIEYGTHAQLMVRNEKYARLYLMQAEQYQDKHLQEDSS